MTREELKRVRKIVLDYIVRLQHEEIEKYWVFKSRVEEYASAAGVRVEFDLDEPGEEGEDFCFAYAVPPGDSKWKDLPPEKWRWKRKLCVVKKLLNFPEHKDSFVKLAEEYEWSLIYLTAAIMALEIIDKEIKGATR